MRTSSIAYGKAGLLSGGELLMLATALVLPRKPQVLLVDELSLGLAPVVVRELMHYLRRLADESGTCVAGLRHVLAAFSSRARGHGCHCEYPGEDQDDAHDVEAEPMR
jgi:ABC-type branched-subunit amino acid transport system ATPase component